MRAVYYLLIATFCIKFVYFVNIAQLVIWLIWPEQTPSVAIAFYTVIAYITSCYLDVFLYQNKVTVEDLMK